MIVQEYHYGSSEKTQEQCRLLEAQLDQIVAGVEKGIMYPEYITIVVYPTPELESMLQFHGFIYKCDGTLSINIAVYGTLVV